MLNKLFAYFFGVFLLFSSTPTLAADLAPEFNPLCWKKAACESMRAQVAGISKDKLTGDGFIENEAPCVGDADAKEGPWGKCLPANIATTEIAFAGKRTFLNIGDFIIYNYKLAIGLASVVAAIVIVLAGFQWTTSGGNAEVISSAKNKISGSVIGLFIAYTSYFILNTINPNLVNLRLPQTWMIRAESVMPKFCSEAQKKPGAQFFQIAGENDQTAKIDTAKSFDFNLTYDQVTKGDQNCGKRYVMDGGGATACFGDVCGGNLACTNFNPADPKDKNYACRSISIAGTITNQSFLPTGGATGCLTKVLMNNNGFTFPYISRNDGFNGIKRICKTEAGVIYIDTWSGFRMVTDPHDDPEKNIQTFGFPTVSSVPTDQSCGGKNVFIGYALGLTLSKNCRIDSVMGTSDHLIDKNGRDLGVVREARASDNSIPSDQYLPKPVNQVSAGTLYSPEDIIKGGKNIFIDLSSFSQE